MNSETSGADVVLRGLRPGSRSAGEEHRRDRRGGLLDTELLVQPLANDAVQQRGAVGRTWEHGLKILYRRASLDVGTGWSGSAGAGLLLLTLILVGTLRDLGQVPVAD
jgi:hypothetical protein